MILRLDAGQEAIPKTLPFRFKGRGSPSVTTNSIAVSALLAGARGQFDTKFMLSFEVGKGVSMTNRDLAPAERLRAKGMKGKAIIGAAMHKLAHLIHGVLKNGVPYRADWPTTDAA